MFEGLTLRHSRPCGTCTQHNISIMCMVKVPQLPSLTGHCPLVCLQTIAHNGAPALNEINAAPFYTCHLAQQLKNTAPCLHGSFPTHPYHSRIQSCIKSWEQWLQLRPYKTCDSRARRNYTRLEGVGRCHVGVRKPNELVVLICLAREAGSFQD